VNLESKKARKGAWKPPLQQDPPLWGEGLRSELEVLCNGYHSFGKGTMYSRGGEKKKPTDSIKLDEKRVSKIKLKVSPGERFSQKGDTRLVPRTRRGKRE